jgi:glycosyltransferase involved in cell wall biosynthesis
MKEFWEQGHYWHLDISIHGLAGSSIMSAVRFKLFGFKNGYGLEFRQIDGWPRAFAHWPGDQSDSYGPFYRIQANLPIDGSVFVERDAAMLRCLAASLPTAVAEATAELADRPDWRAAAGEVAATILLALGHPGILESAPKHEEDGDIAMAMSAPCVPSSIETAPGQAPTETPAPAYVREVIAAIKTAQLTHVKTSFRALPDRWTPIVLCVLRNEQTRLPDFLRHYREAGVERFCFIDNGSTDGTRQFLLAQPDTDVLEHTGQFSWIEKQAWINNAIRHYGPNRWFIYADADEHIVFQDMATHSFSDLTRTMEYAGIERVRGFLIDMYADCALTRSAYTAPGRLSEAYPFFDSNTYIEERKEDIISVRGGPRARVFGDVDNLFRPEMTKYPLFLSHREEIMANPHHHWPYEPNFTSERYLGILHYKFLPDVVQRIEWAVESKTYWENSLEYRCYQSVIRANPDISLMGEMSAHYAGPDSLVSFGLIRQISWRESNRLTAIYNAAFRRRRAELECDYGALPVGAEAAINY